MVENKGDFKFNTVPEKKPVVSSPDQKIENILSVGGSIKIDNIDGHEYNRLADKYKPQRKDGALRLEFDQDASILTAINLKNVKDTDTKL
jgi:hypothetical protein